MNARARLDGTLTLEGVAQRRLEESTAKFVAETLDTEYSGHAWAVNVEQGMANIFNMALSSTHGYRLFLPCSKAAVLEAGGEILERFGLPRGAVDPDVPLGVSL